MSGSFFGEQEGPFKLELQYIAAVKLDSKLEESRGPTS